MTVSQPVFARLSGRIDGATNGRTPNAGTKPALLRSRRVGSAGKNLTYWNLIPISLAALVAAPAAAEARTPLLRDPVRLNIGILCSWNNNCMTKQTSAMRKALSFVKRTDPPNWKIQQCNRNASRSRYRVDWIGYYNCIRNSKLKRRPVRR
jgi:hypothetical protein